MRRNLSLVLSLVGLAAALVASGCGGSSAVTGPEEGAGARGAAVLQGAILGAGLGSSSSSAPVHALSGGSGWTVSVTGTSLTGEVDDEGRFALSGVPAGSVTLRIEGPGVSAQVQVTGLVDGQVTSIEVRVSGGSAQMTTTPTCTPTADTFFSGTIDRIAGTQLVVAGKSVDASQIKKVWRGEKRIQLSDLQVGEKVKVWGLLRGDGVVVAEEIAALTSGPGEGGETWVTLSGRIDSMGASSLGLHANPSTGSYPTFVIKGITVFTNGETKAKWSDGSPMSLDEIKVGQTATVEGWKKADGRVRATQVVVQGTGTDGGATWTTFKGTVQGVVALDAGGGIVALDGEDGVRAACILKLTIGGRKVETDGSTVFKWSDGSDLDPYAVKAGDNAYVEGWSKPEGYTLATKLQIDKR